MSSSWKPEKRSSFGSGFKERSKHTEIEPAKMFSLFTFLLAVANLHAITNNRVQREFDTKGNLFFAKYTISFMHESNEELPTSYIFPLEFPIDKMSSISFTLNGSNVKAKYDTEFASE